MVYTQFISELSEHREPCCPVCRRSFPSESEVQEVVRVLQSKLHLVPEKLKITEQDLERTEEERGDSGSQACEVQCQTFVSNQQSSLSSFLC